jgi:hypothetical protein
MHPNTLIFKQVIYVSMHDTDAQNSYPKGKNVCRIIIILMYLNTLKYVCRINLIKLQADIFHYKIKVVGRYTKYSKLLIMMDVNIKKLALLTK